MWGLWGRNQEVRVRVASGKYAETSRSYGLPQDESKIEDS
jgi:hypothetical protein